MAQQRSAVPSLCDIVNTFARYPYRWAVPTFGILLSATLFAFLRTPKWEAAQAIVIRNEALAPSDRDRPGQFERVEQMKTLQETIMELARSSKVARAALDEVGPPDGYNKPQWPNEYAVAKFRKKLVKVSPPKGAVFGETEIFYVKTKDADRKRAIELAAAVCRQAREQLGELRNAKAESMIAELENAVAMAKNELDEATLRLGRLEAQVAGDLGELRVLQQAPSGDSDLRRRRIDLETELRAAREELDVNNRLRQLLVEATGDPERIVATPNSLLTSQPSLSRLKDGLIDARINTAQLKGQLRDTHPQLIAAKAAEAEIQERIRREMQDAIRGIDVDLGLTQSRVERLENELSETQLRLKRLASVRAAYGNTLEEITHLTKILQSSQQNLAEARARRATAHAVSLMSLVGQPETGPNPTGPSKLMIMFGGLLGGFAIGCGVLFLTLESGTSESPSRHLTTAEFVQQHIRPGFWRAIDRVQSHREKWAGVRQF